MAANDPNATALTATSGQLALGNGQWIELKMKISDLIRVGTDPSRTLANIAAAEILVSSLGSVAAIAIHYDALWLQGGYGPDVGDTGNPYVYAGRYRSSKTGAISNPSPPSRGGVVPRRQYLDVSIPASSEADADLVDYFRFGGALTAWTYTGTAANGATFRDANADTNIDGGEILSFARFQPWPITDLPRQGTCNVAGTSITRVSGDTFNSLWAPGSLVVVNGVATTLYCSPLSTTQCQVTTNLGSATNVPFNFIGPTILGQPLSVGFGGAIRGIVYVFAVGDPNDPGALHWSYGNDPDTTSDTFVLIVTGSDEPLQNGVIYDGQGFVFSPDDLYQILPTNDPAVPFVAPVTPCGRGLKYSKWAMCGSPDGMYFLTDDGIGLTAGGPAEIVTNPDLQPLFPHDGSDGQAVNGIQPPDFSQDQFLRLSWVDGIMYFDFIDINGQHASLGYQRATKRWFYDTNAHTGITVRLDEPGDSVHVQILGGVDGTIYQVDDNAFSDDGSGIAYELWTNWPDGGDPRLQKQFGDGVIDVDMNGAVTGLTVTPVIDSGNTVLTPQVVGAGTSVRTQFILDFQQSLSLNAGLRISSSILDNCADQPLIYLWDVAYLPKIENTTLRASDWSNLGYVGAKFVQGVIIRANTYGAAKSVQVQYDGGTIAQTLTINHNHEVEIAYPHASAGWTPFTAHLVRLVGVDNLPWQLLDVRWVYEPAPELATEWTTQFTSHDMPGYLHVRDGVFAVSDQTLPITLTITYEDQAAIAYNVPFTGASYQRVYVVFAAYKGTAVEYSWRSSAPFRLYKRDVSVRAQAWGQPNGYRTLQPFGGQSRIDGAAV